MSNFVFVLDTDKRPLDPVHPGTARHLLDVRKAAVFRRFPFTLILKESCPDTIYRSLDSMQGLIFVRPVSYFFEEMQSV